jgi:hypothetical protein
MRNTRAPTNGATTCCDIDHRVMSLDRATRLPRRSSANNPTDAPVYASISQSICQNQLNLWSFSQLPQPTWKKALSSLTERKEESKQKRTKIRPASKRAKRHRLNRPLYSTEPCISSNSTAASLAACAIPPPRDPNRNALQPVQQYLNIKSDRENGSQSS